MWQIRREEIKNLFYLAIWNCLNDGIPVVPDINIMAKVPRSNIRKDYESMVFNEVNKKIFKVV